MEVNRLKWLKSVKLTSNVFLEIKRKQLAELISKNAYLPDQGTKEWLEVRRFNIGGSEMSVITGENGFSNIKKLVATKAGLVHFTGRLATRWGKMFENVTILLMENILHVDGKIQETSSLKGAVKHQRYSPDGLAVIKILCGDTIAGEYIERYEYLTVLFEFKSPYSSIPNGQIAKYYVPQVMTGLCSIPIADLAIFVNNMYRKCRLQDFNTSNKYDTYFHNKDGGKVEVEEPIALGLIFIYFNPETKKKFLDAHGPEYSDEPEPEYSDEPEPEYSDEPEFDYDGYVPKTDDQQLIDDLIDIALDKNMKPKDFGTSSYCEFNKLMTLFDEGKLSVHYCNPLVIQENIKKIEFMKTQHEPKEQDVETDIKEYIKQIKEFGKKEKFIGFIPYKLFKSDMIVKYRDPDYLKPHENRISEVIEQVKDIVGEDFNDLDSTHTRFRKHFPHKSDWIDREIESTIDTYHMSNSFSDMIPDF